MVTQTDPTIALLEDLVAIDSENKKLSQGARGQADNAPLNERDLETLALHLEV